MKETIELRVVERLARKIFGPEEGVKLGGMFAIRKVTISIDDPRIPQITALQQKLGQPKWCIFGNQSESFFYGWHINRKYTEEEMKRAECFHLIFMYEFEPYGEECGTIYDDSQACRFCGAGAKQVSPLHLRKSSLVGKKDFRYTIADNEFIISRRAVELFQKANVTGFEFRPIMTSKTTESSEWFQFTVTNHCAEINSDTVFGEEPFSGNSENRYFSDNPENQYGCGREHIAGLNLLSELTVERHTCTSDDLQSTRKYKGDRAGVLRPQQMFLASHKVRDIILSNKLLGCRMDIAHLR